MSHLESLIAEYLDWQGYIVKRNIKVGRLSHGGWEGELDIVGYRPRPQSLIHYEPSIDGWSWKKREERYEKKFGAGKNYIYSEVFPWLRPAIPLKQIAVLVSHPKARDRIAGGVIVSVDELMAEIRREVVSRGIMASNAIPEQYPLLRTVQLTHIGYYKAI
jgi:hypothetical protein